MARKLLKSILVLAVCFAVAGPVVRAQAPNGMVVRIPFAFSVEQQTLPAGEYRILPMDGGRLLFRRSDGKAYTTVFSIPVRSRVPAASGKLIFHQYGAQYFLSQLWAPGLEVGRELLQSRKEQEMAKKQSGRTYAVTVSTPSTSGR